MKNYITITILLILILSACAPTLITAPNSTQTPFIITQIVVITATFPPPTSTPMPKATTAITQTPMPTNTIDVFSLPTRKYIIQPGETCVYIAVVNHITVDNLIQLNPSLGSKCLNFASLSVLILPILSPTSTVTPTP